MTITPEGAVFGLAFLLISYLVIYWRGYRKAEYYRRVIDAVMVGVTNYRHEVRGLDRHMKVWQVDVYISDEITRAARAFGMKDEVRAEVMDRGLLDSQRGIHGEKRKA